FEELKSAFERVRNRSHHPAAPFADASVSAGSMVLDLAQFDHLRISQDEEDPQFLIELIDLFLAETPKRFRELRAALAAGDARAAAQLAHTVKGACANFGGRALETLCLQIEEQMQANGPSGAAVLAGKLDSEFARLSEALTLQKERFGFEYSRR
ncbi:MAG: Hpt domain-containing protein, partial [Verrucomicrobiota bacterium]|nr:Hpt domain-containing protein [Verrucomicrobiota bacterium]